MKTKFLVLATLVVAFFSCTQDKLEEISQADSQPTATRPYNALTSKQVVRMLHQYDETRKPILEQGLGFEDTRINHYSIETLENYLAYVKQLSKEKGIKLTGISFVSAAYPKNFEQGTPNYQTFVFMPTTEVEGKNIPFDAVQSTNEKVVTMKDALAKYGYHWKYDSKEDYEAAKNKGVLLQKGLLEKTADTKSVAGNLGHLSPPFDPDPDQSGAGGSGKR